jgi:hypothetical protein
MATTMIVVPPNAELETAAMTLPDKANAARVVDQASHDEAAEELKAIARLEKQIVEYHRPFKEQANRLHKDICAAETKLLAPLKTARPIYSQKILAWEAEQRRREQELRRQAEAEARRLAEEAAMQAAIEAEKAGATEEVVEQILERPPLYVAPQIAPTYQKSAGITSVDRWRAEVVDINELLRAILDGRLPPSYVEPNMTALNARARAEKDAFMVPGCKAVKGESARVSTR